MKNKTMLALAFMLSFSTVNGQTAKQTVNRTKSTVPSRVFTVKKASFPSPTAQRMAKQGLVNIKDIDPTIKTALMYARTDNFCHKVLYKDLREAYLLPNCAKALKRAQKELKRRRPDLSLVIFDATRPMSVQQTMWDEVKHTNHSFYVSNPANGGGMHNYGMAVDISICKNSWDDTTWRDGAQKCRIDTLPMGAKVDHMGHRSHIDQEASLLAKGLLTKEALANRKLLRTVMESAGFTPLRTEWWHFNLCTRAWARRNLKAVR
ncbi:M15 family metallopeptidase [Prevotella corporis]|uniref:M15 family metallopeptidase n=1 Tax=Prevotella corporis TaxID=28128 RepID=UPI0023F69F16|nr:M15 family metallopeptidase [Prevotella corporis]